MPGNTPEDMARYWIDFTLKRYRENRYGLQALIDKESGAFLGMCGLILQEVNGKNEIEIGYHLLQRYWGNGYATEAAELFRDHAFHNNMTDSIVSIIHPENIPSQKVALRNGMRLVDNHADFRGKENFLFRITKEEWLHLQTA